MSTGVGRIARFEVHAQTIEEMTSLLGRMAIYLPQWNPNAFGTHKLFVSVFEKTHFFYRGWCGVVLRLLLMGRYIIRLLD